jgi:hypothetical protein
MPGTSEFVTFLSESDRLLRLVGPALLWPESMRMALLAKF